MADIFSRNVSYGASFAADAATITFASFGVGLLTQQLTYNYNQTISRIYEIGSQKVYLVAGRTAGKAQVGRIVGPTALLSTFYSTYGNVCNAGTNMLSLSTAIGCTESGAARSIGMNGVVIEGIQGQVQAESMLMQETLEMIFLSLTLS